jgi:hypothetical protein
MQKIGTRLATPFALTQTFDLTSPTIRLLGDPAPAGSGRTWMLLRRGSG